jgi:murein peptide amidase A
MTIRSPHDPHDFMARFDAAAQIAGFAVKEYGRVEGFPLRAYTKRSGLKPALYVSSGMHGDEPAPPWALLQLVETGAFSAPADWFLCPLLNPTGLAQRTRENFQALDLNRDYQHPTTTEVRAHVAWLQQQPRFDATFCLHEDYDAAGFYVYELNPDARPTLAGAALEAACRHCPIDTSAIIDGRESAAPGIIRPVSDPLLREQWPEAIYLGHHHTNLSYTFETPTALPLPVRVAAQADALRASIDALLS